MKKGIDVSEHNGTIDWSNARKEIDFAIIRVGYGPAGTIDAEAHNNINSCISNKIPFGVYWFSYASNHIEAIKEAEHAVRFAENFTTKPLFIAFDFEYDSERYLRAFFNLTLNDKARAEIAKAFCDTIKKYDYVPVLYTNCEYYACGFNLVKNVELWFALWSDIAPQKYAIWQYTSHGTVPGIIGPVDMNKAEKLPGESNVAPTQPVSDSGFDSILADTKKRYINIAQDIIRGKYGNGENRVRAIKEAGFDYEIAQAFVNKMLGY